MATIIEDAVKGKRKAVKYLYETNKKKVYFIARSLFLNEDMATDACIKVFKFVWSDISSNHIETEEEFTRLLITKMAYYYKQKITKQNPTAFKMPNNKNFNLSIPSIFLDEPDQLDDFVLSQFPELHRFVFVLHTIGEIDAEQLTKILNFNSNIMKPILKAEKINIERMILASKMKKEYSYEQFIKDFALKVNVISVPERLEQAVQQIVDIIAKPDEEKQRKKKKSKTVAAVLFCVCATLILFLIGYSLDKTADSENDTTVSDTADTENVSVITSPVVELDETLTYYAVIEIANYGTITVDLDYESAPVTVANFVNLAQSGFYNGLTFHRIIEGFMMQGGDPNGDGTGGSDYNIVGEFTDNGYENSLSHTRGAISMARSSDYDSASSQFFIVHEDSSSSLDGQYAVFGYVTEWLDVVDAICEAAEPTDCNGAIDTEAQPVITSITIRTE